MAIDSFKNNLEAGNENKSDGSAHALGDAANRSLNDSWSVIAGARKEQRHESLPFVTFGEKPVTNPPEKTPDKSAADLNLPKSTSEKDISENEFVEQPLTLPKPKESPNAKPEENQNSLKEPKETPNAKPKENQNSMKEPKETKQTEKDFLKKLPEDAKRLVDIFTRKNVIEKEFQQIIPKQFKGEEQNDDLVEQPGEGEFRVDRPNTGERTMSDGTTKSSGERTMSDGTTKSSGERTMSDGTTKSSTGERTMSDGTVSNR